MKTLIKSLILFLTILLCSATFSIAGEYHENGDTKGNDVGDKTRDRDRLQDGSCQEERPITNDRLQDLICVDCSREISR